MLLLPPLKLRLLPDASTRLPAGLFLVHSYLISLMSSTSASFYRLPSDVQSYIRQRASNYDHYDAIDLFEDLPEALHGNPQAIMGYLKGVPELGVEAREVMHGVSEANGGLDVPSNLQLGPASINDQMGSDNINVFYQNMIDSSDTEAVDVLLDPENAEILADLVEAGTALTAGTSTIAVTSNGPTIGDVIAGGGTVDGPLPAAEAGLGEILGEALVEGLVPAIFAGKAAMAVADQCETTEDKLGYGSLAAGGTVLLYANPVTGPIAWTATGVYSAVKLGGLAWKLWGKDVTRAVYGS